LALSALAGLGVALVPYFGLWHCPVAGLLGVPCPGCGLTRAAAALFALDLRRAFELHPLSPLLVPWAALAFGVALLRVARDGPLRPPRRGSLATLLLVALIAVWISRFFGAFGGPVRVASHLGDGLGDPSEGSARSSR
jgi:hypothetical protein